MPVKIHGHTSGEKHSPTYRSWYAMKKRCLDPNHIKYPRYGGRGVEIYHKWLKFENFLNDMGHRPDNTTLDRFPDRHGNYEPGNCRWATDEQQTNNRDQSTTIYMTLNGITHSISEWSKILGIKRGTIRSRLSNGYSDKIALTKPVDRRIRWR